MRPGTITTAQLFITQSAVEVDRPQGYQRTGTRALFDYAKQEAVDIREQTPIRNTERTGYITFRDQSTVVAAKCRQRDNQEPNTWKIAEALTDKDGRTKPPADPEGPEWVWIGGQDDAPAWAGEMERLLAQAAMTAGNLPEPTAPPGHDRRRLV